ncbi:MAG: glycosyltransferase family 2 protein [Elusimicrobiota bacterium]|jgi:glycosyltransferase involved in cell wall biosynthesis|nr:glycosyltransferase family 2 protein [Elusimicrobiota bacterium]
MQKVSAYIITKNSQAHLYKALESIQWADEIVIVDDFSCDKTCEIAAHFKAKIVEHKFENFGAQRNFALTCLTYDWVLCLDSDECISAELKIEILQALKNPTADIYLAPRKTFFINRWIMHSGWYPDYRHPVLFNKKKAQYKNQLVHEDIDYKGERKQYFSGDILHYSYDNVEQFIKKSDQYSGLSAQQMFARGKRAKIYNFIFNPLNMFLKMFIFKRGFLDKKTGFILAMLYAYFYTLMKYIKLWQLEQNRKDKNA